MEVPELAAVQAVLVEVVEGYRSRLPAGRGREKGDGSLVTELDIALQRELGAALARRWPQFPLVGEEMEAAQQQRLLEGARALWVLDPLDGTTNAAFGLPFYAVSLALVVAGEARLGLVYDPERGECFAALRGGGAWLNGQPLVGARPHPVLAKAIACVDLKRLPEGLAVRIAREQPFRSQRNLGACALEWCWLAAGRVQVYLHGGMRLWDHAAGHLILTEAGGHACDLEAMPLDCRSTRARSVVAATDAALLEQWRSWLGV